MTGRVAKRAAPIALVALLAAGGLWLLLRPSSCGTSARDGAPNVVLISLDTTRRDHLSMYGYERETSPRMDEVSAEGVTFEAAIAAHTNTAPSHASMLTGLYPATHGVERNGYRLDSEIPTLGEILQEHGYATGGFVSGWTLSRHTGLDRGFETYDDEMPGNGRRLAELTLAAALPWLRDQVEEGAPFFLFFHLFDPHYPYDPPEGYAERFLPDGATAFQTVMDGRPPGPKPQWRFTEHEYQEYISRYDGEIAYADHQLGLLMDELERLGVADDTLVIFTSDHGDTLHERYWVFDHGGRAYDEQIRVPLVIRMPGRAHAGKRVESQVGHVDYFPTILQALGIPVPEEISGRSLLPLMEMETDEDRSRPAFAHARPEPARVPEIQAPLIRDGLVSVIRLPNIKLLEYPMAGGQWFRQLFDLSTDPGETQNVAEDRGEAVDSLHDELDRYRVTTGGDEVAPPQELAPDVEEALRALGYVE